MKNDPRRNDTSRSDTKGARSTPYDPPVYASALYRPRRGNEDHCNRCNIDGHYARQCPLIALGQWFCYVCRRNVTHIGADCPLKHQVENKFVNSKSSKSVPHSRGKPHKSRSASWSKRKGRGSVSTRGCERGTGQVTKSRSNVETPGRAKKFAARAAVNKVDTTGYEADLITKLLPIGPYVKHRNEILNLEAWSKALASS
ncbi:hypothetical protein QAD02_003014 [Eretmocerus hayati]|uniref:Uncharacterized protein n=1 Tax=Eretmocerus hayati TaxID=131215 RepID=A0ACC2NKI0_9HYME|nr:hypothetical protein QAD02_003014 [Eretmocerus hayati]